MLGFFGGLVNVPLRSGYLAAVPADARGNAMSVMNTAIYLLTSALALLLVSLARIGLLSTPSEQLAFLAALTALGTALALALLPRETIENILDIALLPMYRIRIYGPGVKHFPMRGPLLIVANHSSYIDPIWVGKIVPQFIHPMMTSVFYDLPVLRGGYGTSSRSSASRRPPTVGRHPELVEAVAMLQCGKCVVIFPEAMLRRTEEQLLRPFGQGVWHILREVPETPVAVLWIEGGFGTYFSYKNGPPGKNKHIDWWRHIDIGISGVQPLPPSILVDHRTTRDYLHRTCLECRRYLGLEVPVETKRSEQAGTRMRRQCRPSSNRRTRPGGVYFGP